MKATISIIIFLLFYFISVSQQSKFSKVYFDNNFEVKSNGMAKSNDGGLIVCGEYDSNASVFKIDSLGIVQWAYQIGSSQIGKFSSIIRTNDSCYVLIGNITTSSSNKLDFYIVKIDPNGNVIWAKTIYRTADQMAISLQETFDGGFIVTGSETLSIAQNPKILLIKLNTIGDVDWYECLNGGNFEDYGISVKQTPDSGFALIGVTMHNAVFQGYGLLCKLSQSGTVQWSNKYHENLFTSIGYDLVVANDGIYSNYDSFNGRFLVKTGYNGIDIWRKAVAANNPRFICPICIGEKLKLLSDGNLLLTSGVNYFPYSSLLIKLDTAGNYIWSKSILNSVHGVDEADDGGFFLLGNGPFDWDTNNSSKPFTGIIKSDPFGNADICTSPESTVVISNGNITQDTLMVTATSFVANSTLIFPVITTFSLHERTSCIDASGEIVENVPYTINLYPVPNESTLNIKLTGWTYIIELQIVDVIGQIVFKKEYNMSTQNEIKIDHDFASGVYSAIIYSNREPMTSKFVVR